VYLEAHRSPAAYARNSRRARCRCHHLSEPSPTDLCTWCGGSGEVEVRPRPRCEGFGFNPLSYEDGCLSRPAKIAAQDARPDAPLTKRAVRARPRSVQARTIGRENPRGRRRRYGSNVPTTQRASGLPWRPCDGVEDRARRPLRKRRSAGRRPGSSTCWRRCRGSGPNGSSV
jgi:hypothetical protein